MFDYTYIYFLAAIASLFLISIIRNSRYIGKTKIKYLVFAIMIGIVILFGYIGREMYKNKEQYHTATSNAVSEGINS